MAEQTSLDLVEVFSPTQLNREIRLHLEGNYPAIWVEGEISNLSQPASGHSYFSLKDDSSQLRCALFRQHRLKLRLRLEAGSRVRVRGRLSLYEARGDYQLIADRVELAGQGQLLQQFEQLKRTLAAEGLFAEARKRALPQHPRRIAVVTSPSGAAVRDVLSVLRRRYPSVEVTVVPTLVQGEAAPKQIIKALEQAAQLSPDLILLTRGGGSIEDLWAFNDEGMARAIAASGPPVVAAIGHEVDSTIADFVADAFAVTPSAAAEMITPDRAELLARLQVKQERFAHLVQAALDNHAQRLDQAERQLRRRDPRQQLQQRRQRLLELSRRLPYLLAGAQDNQQQRLRYQHSRLLRCDPRQRLALGGKTLRNLGQRLQQLEGGVLPPLSAKLAAAAGALNALSPLAVLQRGYSLTTTEQGEVVLNAAALSAGQTIHTRLANGEVESQVVTTSQPSAKPS